MLLLHQGFTEIVHRSSSFTFPVRRNAGGNVNIEAADVERTDAERLIRQLEKRETNYNRESDDNETYINIHNYNKDSKVHARHHKNANPHWACASYKCTASQSGIRGEE